MALLSKDQLDYFDEFGFLPLSNVFNPDEVTDPVIEEYKSVLNSLAEKLFEEGKISSKFENLSFAKKLTKIMQETGESHAGFFDFSLPAPSAVTMDYSGWFGPAVFCIDFSTTVFLSVSTSVVKVGDWQGKEEKW